MTKDQLIADTQSLFQVPREACEIALYIDSSSQFILYGWGVALGNEALGLSLQVHQQREGCRSGGASQH